MATLYDLTTTLEKFGKEIQESIDELEVVADAAESNYEYDETNKDNEKVFDNLIGDVRDIIKQLRDMA
jgi:chorismate mutase